MRIGFQVDAVQPLEISYFCSGVRSLLFALKPCKNAVFDLLLIFSAVAEQIFQQLRHRFALWKQISIPEEEPKSSYTRTMS